VTVTVGDLDDGFYVADDGTGIPEADREELFGAESLSTGTSSGFGLAIVQEVVAAHGWDINVGESDEGGARFEITGVEFVE
jgi:signal transduction histidine kinase